MPNDVRRVTAPFSYHGGTQDQIIYVYPRAERWIVSDGMTIWHANRSKPTAVAYAKVVAEHYGKRVELMTKPLYPWKEP